MKKEELLKELRRVQDELNCICDEDVIVHVGLEKDDICDIVTLELKDSLNEVFFDCSCEVDGNMNMDNILYNLIRDIYENSVNPLSRFIKSTKAYNTSKIKSLALWKSRNKQDKVESLIDDLVERHTQVEIAKSHMVEPKQIIKYLYQIKSRYTESEVV